MPLSIEEALQHVAPDIEDDEARKESARRIAEGVAANEAYWNSRPELEQVFARAQGHGQVQRGEDSPTAVGTPTEAPAIEGTATDEAPPVTAVEPAPAETAPAPAPSPDNPNEAIATLRAQLSNAGMTPEA